MFIPRLSKKRKMPKALRIRCSRRFYNACCQENGFSFSALWQIVHILFALVGVFKMLYRQPAIDLLKKIYYNIAHRFFNLSTLIIGRTMKMKKSIKRVLALVLAVLTVAVAFAGCSSNGKKDEGKTKYVIATDTVFKPFEYTDASGNFVGIDVDILAAIAEDQGFEYELKSLGWTHQSQHVSRVRQML